MTLLGMDLGPHWAFIVTAYVLMILIVGGLIGWVILDHSVQSRTLADLESRGLRRRSNRGGPGA